MFTTERVYPPQLPVDDSWCEHSNESWCDGVSFQTSKFSKLPVSNLHFTHSQLHDVYSVRDVHDHVPCRFNNVSSVHLDERHSCVPQLWFQSKWCVCVREFFWWNLHASYYDVCSLYIRVIRLCANPYFSGQGIAGVLPAIAQIVSVLAFAQSTGEQSGPSSPKSAFAYFLAATFVSGLSFILFLFLLSRYGLTINSKTNSHFLSCSDSEQDIETRRVVSLFVLWRKLMYPSFAIWLSFCLTMVFPVFTQAITSVKSDGAGRAFQPDVFIPTAFLLWNIGDLSGRIACGWKSVTITSPRMLVFISMSRAAFIPLYVMCNVGGHGAVIENDGFYWLVQLVFGFTNGWVGTSCMIVAPNYVENDEKEVCGGFMGLCLVLGLATGSVMSFFVVIK